jgi:hypothetical protein
MTQQSDWEDRQLRAHQRRLDWEDVFHEAVLAEREVLEAKTVRQLFVATHGLPQGAVLDRLLDELAEALVRARARERR